MAYIHRGNGETVFISDDAFTDEIRRLVADPAANWARLFEIAGGPAYGLVNEAVGALAGDDAARRSAAARAHWKVARVRVLERPSAARANLKRMIDGLTQVGVLGRPKGTIAISEKYWVEKLDGSHRMGDLLHAVAKEHAARRAVSPLVPMSLFDWLTGLSALDIDGLACFKGAGGPWRRAVFKAGVGYLDAIGRASYEVISHRGLLYTQTGPLDTAGMSTAFSGAGVAIFIMTPEGKLFVGSHKFGEFHHSSFLSGNPVRAAGELMVTKGKLIFISAKSGHYKPGLEALKDALITLRDNNISLAQSKVRLYAKGIGDQPATLTVAGVDPLTGRAVPVGHSLPVYIPAVNYLMDPKIRTDYLIWGKP